MFCKDRNLKQTRSRYGVLSLLALMLTGALVGWFSVETYNRPFVNAIKSANGRDYSLKGSSGSALKLTTPQFRDKLRGMLLLGGYGDALGAPHETSGIKGNAGDPASATQLPQFRDYGTNTADPWDVWQDPSKIDGDTLGMPTDDTSYRVAILHQWLTQLATTNDPPTEASFVSWIKSEDRPAADAPEWENSRHDQIRDWIEMFHDATLLARNPDNFVPSCNNPFFRKDVPVVFGPFMHLELAPVYASCSKQDVFTKFSNFGLLDQSYGRFVTGMMAAMMADALCANTEDKKFDEWFFQTAGDILDSNLGYPSHRAVVKDHFQAAKQIGIDSQELSEADFMERLKQVFDEELPLLPSQTERGDFRSFDPLLFLKMMAASVAYSDGDVQQALRVLAVAPGDSDTMASQLGSLIGAWSGEDGLRNLDPDLAADLDQVEGAILDQYNIRLSDLAASLIELAHKHGRLQKRNKVARSKRKGQE